MHNITLIIGIALLLLGRKLFWLFVGAIGFVLGLHLGTTYLQGYGENIALIAGVIGGVIGIVLAIFVQKIAVVGAGFVGGGYIALGFWRQYMGAAEGQTIWIPFIIGGIIGAILVSFLFAWALIILSSLLGAMLVVQGLHLSGGLETIVFVALAAAGIFVQAWMKKKPQPSS